MFRRFIPTLLAAGLAAGCASVATTQSAAPVPANLQPGNERMTASLAATGVQIYECRAIKDKPGQYEWAFVAPEADLFDRSGRKVGRHYAGPHWEALDGSRVVATLKERAPAPAAGAIPWLLLTARPAGPEGAFSKATSIQRVNTVGGVAPQTGCSQASLGATSRVAYKADYNFFATAAHANAVTDWNAKAGDFVAGARMGTPPAIRLMAVVQTAVLESVKAAPAGGGDAAVAAANRTVLLRLLPGQAANIEAAYQSAIKAIPEGPARAAGIQAGEKAAAAVLAARSDDGAGAPEQYRPSATPGTYIPTVIPGASQWAQRKPWLMSRPDQFRPAPPPPLSSALWSRDYNEVKLLGSRNSTVRTPGQTDAAKFWEFSLPSIYFNVVSSAAAAEPRDLARNAKLYAAAAQAMDDALIAVMDAKYHYNFWRPATAIRNGDADGNDATARDAGWVPLIDAPMHPEYPSAHAILAGAVGAVLQAEIGPGPVPVLATTSPTLKGAQRRWSRVEDFMQEVADARVHEGIHYRHSTEVGLGMGKRIGALAVSRHLAPGASASASASR